MKKQEFIIWGIPSGETSEIVVISEKANIESYDMAKWACGVLEEKHGIKNTRIQIIDFSDNIFENFNQTVNQ